MYVYGGGIGFYCTKHFVLHFVCMKSAIQIKSDGLIDLIVDNYKL